MALTESTMLELGTIAPDFALTDVVTGKTVRRDDFRDKKALLVMFICTHCPYVKHVEKGLAALGNDYAGRNLGIVAISSNDVSTHPDDSPAALKRQAETMGFVFPYLYDETQAVAHAYKAACTPDFFLFDGAAACLSRPVRFKPPRQRGSGHRPGPARGDRPGARRRIGADRSTAIDRMQYQMESVTIAGVSEVSGVSRCRLPNRNSAHRRFTTPTP